MDLNYLLERRRIERLRAHTGACEQARSAHADLADLYQQAIEDLTKGKVRFVAAGGHVVH